MTGITLSNSALAQLLLIPPLRNKFPIFPRNFLYTESNQSLIINLQISRKIILPQELWVHCSHSATHSFYAQTWPSSVQISSSQLYWRHVSLKQWVQGQETRCKGWIVNILGFVGHIHFLSQFSLFFLSSSFKPFKTAFLFFSSFLAVYTKNSHGLDSP